MIKIIVIIIMATFGFLILAGIGAILYATYLIIKKNRIPSWEEECNKEQKAYMKFLSDKLNE